MQGMTSCNMYFLTSGGNSSPFREKKSFFPLRILKHRAWQVQGLATDTPQIHSV